MQVDGAVRQMIHSKTRRTIPQVKKAMRPIAMQRQDKCVQVSGILMGAKTVA